MGIVSCVETWDGRGARADVDGKATASRSFRVITDDARETWPTVAAAPGISLGDPHPEIFTLYCSGISPRQANKFLWEVGVDYKNDRERSESPLDEPAEIEWDSEQFQKPAVKNRDGDAILNAAGDPFDPPAEMDDSRRVVTVKKNLAVVPTWILDYQDAVNSDSCNIDGVSIAAGLAKVQRVSVGPEQSRNNVTFRQVTIVIHLQRDGWDLSILNRGFRYKSGTNRIKIFFDSTGGLASPSGEDATEPTEPVLLDSTGGVLSNPSSTNATFVTESVYVQRAFSALPLS